MKGLVVTATILLAITMPAHAGDMFDTFQFNRENCDFNYAGTGHSKKKYSGESRYGSCSAVVDAKAFHKEYSMCAVSYVSTKSDKGNLICGFDYYNRDHSKVSFTLMGEGSCHFSCLKR